VKRRYVEDLLATLDTDVPKARAILVRVLRPFTLTPDGDSYRISGALNLSAVVGPGVSEESVAGAPLRGLDIAGSLEMLKTTRLLEHFLRPLAVLEFTSDDALAYATVRAKLEHAGTPIGPLDTLIAAQAVARKLTLVSNNEREFKRIAGLRLENWASV
jgi:hypothetical protein